MGNQESHTEKADRERERCRKRENKECGDREIERER